MTSRSDAYSLLGIGIFLLGLAALVLALALADKGYSDRVEIASTLGSVFVPAGGTVWTYGHLVKEQERRLRKLIRLELEQTISVLTRPAVRDFRVMVGSEAISVGLAPVYDLYFWRAAELEAIDDEARQEFLRLAAKVRSYNERFSRLLDAVSHRQEPFDEMGLDNLRSEITHTTDMASEIALLCKKLLGYV